LPLYVIKIITLAMYVITYLEINIGMIHNIITLKLVIILRIINCGKICSSNN
jgi:hypothetical protein